MEGGESPLSVRKDGGRSEAAELVGFKDGVKVTPSSSSTSDMVALSIKCPSLSDIAAESTLLSVPSHFSIAQVKSQIESTWSGRPQAHGMRIFKSGQMLTDEMIVGDIVPLADRAEPAPIHLVIRPTAWSEPRPSIPPRQRSNKAAPAPPSPHEAWVEADSIAAAAATTTASTSASSQQSQAPSAFPTMHLPQHSRSGRMGTRERHLANVIEKMDPTNYSSFRSLLTWSYYKYVDLYEERWKEVYGHLSSPANIATEQAQTVEQLAKGMNCSNEEILAAVQLVESDVLLWKPIEEVMVQDTAEQQSSMAYKTVTLQGLPYLLQMKRDARCTPLSPLMKRIKYLQDLIHRMDKLINYQALFDQASNTTALQANMRRNQSALLGSAGLNGGHHNGVAGTGQRGATRRYQFRIVLNMNEFVNVALPAFFMSLKVTLMVYIFTRGATTLKTCLIAGAGVIYVILEAWKTAHRQNERRRQAAMRAREARNGSNNRPPAASSSPHPGQENLEEDSNMESLRPRVPVRHQATSRFAIDYWIEALAYVGLSAEESEFGWHPLNTRREAGFTSLSGRVFTMVKNLLLLPVLLMLVTLIPEIEQKRRRAIDQREELIRTTAKKVEDRRARLKELKRERKKGDGVEITKTSAITTTSATSTEQVPSYLQHPYCQRIIHQRRVGRQIDIAQELEAAAAAAGAAGDGPGANQADMGFL